MKDIQLINKELKKQFIQTKSYTDFEKYVMSELLSPIEDYYNFVNLVECNFDLIEGLNLIYIASYINSLWRFKKNCFIEKLNSSLNLTDDCGKAIIYYLNAFELKNNVKNSYDEYVSLLKKSISYSRNIKFAHNRFDLAQCLNGEEREKLFLEAKQNIVEVSEASALGDKSSEWWLSSQRYINEFILGTHISDSNFKEIIKYCE